MLLKKIDLLKYKISVIISRAIWNLPGKMYIVFESNPDFADNTGAVFRRMLEDGKWKEKYRFVWFVHDKNAHYPNVMCLRSHAGGWNRIRRVHVGMRTAAIIDCNIQTMKRHPQTVHIYLAHGSPIKSVREYYFLSPETDYMLSQSAFWDSINSYEMRLPEDRMVTLGYPRNDDLFDRSVETQKLFADRRFEMTVIWYPTYRQHKLNTDSPTVAAIPVLHDGQTAERLNALAQQYGVLLVVKPHPAQKLDYIKKLNLSNIVFIDDSFFDTHGIRAYQFLASTDALITDYSSVFFDYLLTGKPIGLTFEDYESYKEKPGFAIDTTLITDCSYMLDTIADFENFFQVIVSGEDPMHEKRDEVMRLSNRYLDADSSQRVLDFIEEKLKERNLWKD